LLFHFHPAQRPAVDPVSLSTVSFDGEGTGISIQPLDARGLTATLHEGEGEEGDGPPQGWVAFESGVKVPAPVLRYRREGPAPARFATILVPLAARGARGPEIEALRALDESGREARDAVAGRLVYPDGEEELFLARPLDEPARPSGAPALRAAGLETDALFASVSIAPGGEVSSAAMYRGSELRWEGKAVELGRLGHRPHVPVPDPEMTNDECLMTKEGRRAKP
jgi:hypothetical protein